MYYERLPAYEYELPCGRTFRSLTQSEPYRRKHYFPCEACRTVHEVKSADLVEIRPRNGAGRLSDKQLFIRVDAAIEKDRVRKFYRYVWDSMSVRAVAAATGVQREAVEAVAADLGVYRLDVDEACEDGPSERFLSSADSVSANH